jgi:CRISPR-associated protein Cmr5
MKSIAQLRAEHALKEITEKYPKILHERAKHESDMKKYQEILDKSQKRFNSYVASFGPMILMNGFGQACAFYMAKKKEHGDVINCVTNWLQQKDRPFHNKAGHIVNCITESDIHTYRLAQVEALAYLDWLKKLAKAFLKSEAGEEQP